MNKQNLIVLATLGISFYEELSHPYNKNVHTHNEQQSILAPHTVNVYNISGRVQYITVNDAVLAIRPLG